jgi:hypothetical protein
LTGHAENGTEAERICVLKSRIVSTLEERKEEIGKGSLRITVVGPATG